MQKSTNEQTNEGVAVNWQPNGLSDDLVRLVPLLPEHFEQLYAVASDPLIWEQHPDRYRYQREVFQNFFDAAITSGTAFLIIDKASDIAIGSSRFYDYKPEDSSIAIGYTFLGRSFWGGRFNKAVKMLMLQYAFQFVDKVFFHIGIQNIRSQTAIKKLGAIMVREMDFQMNGASASHFEYVINRP